MKGKHIGLTNLIARIAVTLSAFQLPQMELMAVAVNTQLGLQLMAQRATLGLM